MATQSSRETSESYFMEIHDKIHVSSRHVQQFMLIDLVLFQIEI